MARWFRTQSFGYRVIAVRDKLTGAMTAELACMFEPQLCRAGTKWWSVKVVKGSRSKVQGLGFKICGAWFAISTNQYSCFTQSQRISSNPLSHFRGYSTVCRSKEASVLQMRTVVEWFWVRGS